MNKNNEKMTDKQIIIDGVDVSNCKFWKGYCRLSSLCDYAGHLCELTPNCDYKQLARKEQECEQQKAKLELFKTSNQTTIDQLKAENEHLAEKEEEAKHYLEEAYKYKQTLAEIKPILEFYANSKMGEKQTDGTYKIMTGGGYIMAYDPRPAKEALRKINEVEDE